MKTWFLWMALTIGTFFTGLAHADIEDAMREHLNSMVAVTPPTTFESSNQAGIYFGSFSQRYQMVNTPPLMSFTPPSLRGGCGGWDLFAGSFSFISAEQIMNLLRSLASAVPAIAFQMALSVLSDELEEKVGEYLDKLNKLNLGQLNTCRITTSLLEVAKDKQGMGDVWAMIANDIGLNYSVENNHADDASEAGDTSGGNSPGPNAARMATPEERSQMVVGNLVWRILKDGNADQWLSLGSGDETLEQWMSVIGTEIGCYKRKSGQCEMDPEQLGLDDDNEATPPKPETRTKGHTLTLRDLVLTDPNVGQKVSLLRCVDGTEAMECLRVTKIDTTNFKGMRRVLEDELLGVNRLPGEGLVGRYASRVALSNRDKRMQALGGPLLKKALEYTDVDEALGRRFVETFTRQVATEITYTLLKDVIAEARVSMSGNHRLTGEGKGLQLLAETERRIEAEMMQMMAEDEAQRGWAVRLEGEYMTALARRK